MATKTIPQLTLLPVPIAATALLEISQAGSFHVTGVQIQQFIFTSTWTGDASIEIDGTISISTGAVGAGIQLTDNSASGIILTSNASIALNGDNISLADDPTNQDGIALIGSGQVQITSAFAGINLSTASTGGSITLTTDSASSDIALQPTRDLLLNVTGNIKVGGTSAFTGTFSIGINSLTFKQGLLTAHT